MLAKNRKNRNKTDNRAKTDKNNIDFMTFIQNDTDGHIEWEQIKPCSKAYKGLFVRVVLANFRNGLPE